MSSSLYPSEEVKQHYVYLVYEAEAEESVSNLIEGKAFRSEKRVKDYFRVHGKITVQELSGNKCLIHSNIGIYKVYKILRGDTYTRKSKTFKRKEKNLPW